jgi:hypothetical protein
VNQCESALATLLLTVTVAVPGTPQQAPIERPANLNSATLVAYVPALVGLGLATDAATDGRAAQSTAEARPAFFFGFVEFDHDPNAPGGVAGFGPWPQSTGSNPSP